MKSRKIPQTTSIIPILIVLFFIFSLNNVFAQFTPIGNDLYHFNTSSDKHKHLSQFDEVNTLEEHQAMFSEIDVSRITTGILYDRVIPFSNIEKYNGKNEDAIYKQSSLKQIYFEIQRAKYDKDTANIHNLDFIFGTKRQFTNGKLIPIYLLNYRYNKIKKNAFDDKLLLIQNGKIIENPAKNENTYEAKKVFSAAPYKTHTY